MYVDVWKMNVELKLSSWIMTIVPFLTKSDQISSLHNSPPPETYETHKIILKSIKHEHGKQKLLHFFVTRTISSPPSCSIYPNWNIKKMGLRLNPLPCFGPMSQILLGFFLKASLSWNICIVARVEIDSFVKKIKSLWNAWLNATFNLESNLDEVDIWYH